ncbi:MAG: exodeoxyribonuclease VII small subunit [Clostridia bacterium]|nr:exodeoxyribonuclease VII small subunit [Clostridia bacterium]
MELKFEEKISELEKIVNKLEDGTLSLDESITLFEKGIKLSKDCQKILDDAEKKISVLMEDEKGDMTAVDFPDLENE